MESGVFCGSYGGKVSGDSRGDCTFELTCRELLSESKPLYHRRTFISSCSTKGLRIVKSSESSWIAVKGEEYMCVVIRDVAEAKSENPNVYEIFSDSIKPPNAEVSVILGTNELCVGNGIADSFAEYNEELAIKYLCDRLKKPVVTYDETLQTAISAYRRLLPGNINGDGIKICVGKRKKSSIRKVDPSSPIIIRDNKEIKHHRSITILESTEVAALFKMNYEQCSENQSMRCLDLIQRGRFPGGLLEVPGV